MEDKNVFSYLDNDGNQKKIVLNEDDFTFVQKDKEIKDVKLESKPTTFFKDAMIRFRKNKSSVVGGVIIGILTLLAIIVPFAVSQDIDTTYPYQALLPSKLFPSGTGFWDGTTLMENKPYDVNTELPYGYTNARSISLVNKTEDGENFINVPREYAYGGYVRFSSDENSGNKTYSSSKYLFNINYNIDFTYSLLNEDTNDGYVLGEYALMFSYDNNSFFLTDFSSNYGEHTINLSTLIKEKLQGSEDEEKTQFKNGRVSFVLKNNASTKTQILIEKAVFSSNNDSIKDDLNSLSIIDANKTMLASSTSLSYWECNGYKNVYKARVIYCTFRYDKYEDVYGLREDDRIGKTDMEKYIANGWCEYDFDIGESSFKKLSEKCPVEKVIKQTKKSMYGIEVVTLQSEYYNYKYLGYDTMPMFLFGSDDSGRDLLKVSFSGLRTSLLVGFLVFVICFSFGLVWGAISGYFGGVVDLTMERFCDILGGIPFTVMLILFILHLGSNFGTFILAMCFTGWMSTAATTRTQFYRFKIREYILASRSLGAKDCRLIFKHILPNALGTIITSSVLMIPSVIFSEASIAYLGFGLTGAPSFGVTLANNQKFISSYPMLIVFPSVLMSLLMISFNLFGNGLRDAFNPSLKGSEE